MKRIISLVVVALFIVGYGYCSWDETKPAQTQTVSAAVCSTLDNFNAINAVFGTMLDTGTALTTNTVEFNYVDGVTSAIQTQLGTKLGTANVYDSGWFACSIGGTYSKTHGLGTTKLLTRLYFSTSSDGSDAMEVSAAQASGGEPMGGLIKNITTTTVEAQAGGHYVFYGFDGDGSDQLYTSGYYRIVLLALE